ncbi:MAG: hypothetical protein CL908_20905 [Deltaproteobacteria bacterium]|nr:hypothetical protein [Deltaproteobacteria bacterium]
MIQKPQRMSKPQIVFLTLIAMAAFHPIASAQEASGGAADDPEALADPWSGVEEMVVRGTSGIGLVLDSAVSVTAFDADKLESLGISDVADLAPYTPNLEIRTAGSTTPILFIRGVGLNDFTSNAAGAVAVYQDDVPMNLPGFQSAQLFDVESVGVEKGPQGSGPGRNASAGAIRSFSRKPTGEFNAFLKSDFGNFNSREFEGALGLPVIPDLLAARISFKVRQRDGIVDNACGNQPPFNADDPNDPINLERVVNPTRRNQSLCGELVNEVGREPFFMPNPVPGQVSPLTMSTLPAGLDKDMNDLNNWALRGQLRFQPPGLEMEWTLNVHGSRVDQLGTVGQPLGTSAGFLGSATKSPQAYNAPEIRQEFIDLMEEAGIGDIPHRRCARDPVCAATRERVDVHLGRKLASHRPMDRKPFDGAYNRPGHERQEAWGASLRGQMEFGSLSVMSVTGWERYDRSRLQDFDYTPTTIFEFATEDDAWQATQDLRFEQALESIPVTWKAGGFFLAETLEFDQKTIAGGNILPLTQVYKQKTFGVGVYGEFEWLFTDDFELTAGVRWNSEHKQFDVVLLEIIQDQNLCNPRVGRGPKCDDRTTFSDPTGTVSLKYNFNGEVSAYAKYSRGWKGQQYNISNGRTRDTFRLAKPESIDSVEAGFRGTWFDGRLGMGGALFLYRYDNYQVFLFTNDLNTPPQRIVKNANAARLYGAEFDIRIEPIERLVADVQAGWIESRFLDFKDSGVREIRFGGDNPPPPRILEIPIDYTGNRLPNTPRFKVSGSLEYTFESETSGSLTPHYDFTYTDEFSFDPSDSRGQPNDQNELFMPKHTIGQKAYVLHNARITYKNPSETIEASVWVRNITDEVYKTLAFDASAIAGLVGNLVGDPRTYGVGLKLSY